jgi:hypothetical protein
VIVADGAAGPDAETELGAEPDAEADPDADAEADTLLEAADAGAAGALTVS